MSSIEPDAILNCTLCYGPLEANGVPMLNQYGAWCLPDLSPLWGNPDQRGDDQVMPGPEGARGFPRRETITTHQVRFWCSGQVDGQTGVLAADNGLTPEGQLRMNMAYLRTEVFAAVGSGTGTYTVVWEPPGDAPIVARCRMLLPADGLRLLPKGVLRGTVTIEDPYTELHL